MKFSSFAICTTLLSCAMTVNAATSGTQIASVAVANSTSPATWIAQDFTTSKFTFSVLVSQQDETHFAVSTVRITDQKSGKLLQEISEIGGFSMWIEPTKIVQIFDVNRDGYPDFSVPFADGGAGPNSTKNFYLFDPQQNRFEINQQLSDLSDVSLNADGTITSSYRVSCCEYQIDTYRFIRNKLTKVGYWNEHLTYDGKWIETSTSKLVHNKWHSKTTKKPVPKDY